MSEEDRALSVATYIKLMRAADSVTHRVNRILASYGLTISQFGVLEAINSLGPLSQKDLSKKILRSHGNISIVIDNLEKRDLVRRVRGLTNDRRIVIVQMTPAGEELITRIMPVMFERVVSEMAVLSPEEQRELGRLSRRVGLVEDENKGIDDAGLSSGESGDD